MVRIAHLSDLHMESSPETHMRGVRQTLRKGAALVRQASPDFVLVSGDLTSYGSANPVQLRVVKGWLDDLEIPYLAIPGNHDLGANAKRGEMFPESEYYHSGPWESTYFAEVFRQPPLVVKEVGPLRLIGLALREGDPDGVLVMLREELAMAIVPTVIIGHYPLIPVHTTGILANFGIEDYIPRTSHALLRIIQQHPQVILYAAGHVHAVTVHSLPCGPRQITAGGFGPGPSQWWMYEAHDTFIKST